MSRLELIDTAASTNASKSYMDVMVSVVFIFCLCKQCGLVWSANGLFTEVVCSRGGRKEDVCSIWEAIAIGK